MKASYRSLAAAVFFSASSFIPVSCKRTEPLFPRAGDPPPSAAKLDDQLKESEERLSRNPADLKALVDRGIIYYLKGPEHYADALNSLNAAWRAGAFDVRIFYFSGLLYENLSLFEEAERQYERFLNHQPADREVRLRLARLLFRMNKWEESIASYQALLADNGNDVTSLVNCGTAFHKRALEIQAKKQKTEEDKAELTRCLEQATTYLEKAAKVQPDLPAGVQLTLAEARFDQGNWSAAAAAAEAELAKDPAQTRAYELLAASHEKSGDPQKALDAYTRWSQQAPQNPKVTRSIRTLKRQLKIK